MAATYTPISSTTLGSAASSITFSSIPSTYTDLVVIMVFGQTTGDDIIMRFNGDSGNNYSSTRLAGNGTAASSSATTNYYGIQPRIGSNPPSTITTIWRENIQNYANTTTYKTAIGRLDFASGQTETHVGLWRSTSAINSVTLMCQAQTWVAGTVATLYGILAA